MRKHFRYRTKTGWYDGGMSAPHLKWGSVRWAEAGVPFEEWLEIRLDQMGEDLNSVFYTADNGKSVAKFRQERLDEGNVLGTGYAFKEHACLQRRPSPPTLQKGPRL